MALLEKLQDIKIIKNEIKNSLENKGVDTTNATFADYPELIESIQSDGGEIYEVEDMRNIFMGNRFLTEDGKIIGIKISPTCKSFQYVFNGIAPGFVLDCSMFPWEQVDYLPYFNGAGAGNYTLKNFDKYDISKCQKKINGNLTYSGNSNYHFYFEFVNSNVITFDYSGITENDVSLSINGYSDFFVVNGFDKIIMKVKNVSKNTFSCGGFGGIRGDVNVPYEVIFENCNSITSLTSFGCRVSKITNLDLSKVTNVSKYAFYETHYNTKNTNNLEIIFSGSFGGNSTTASLTLDFSYCPNMSVAHTIQMFESMGENTNGNTRILKLSSTLYSSLTEDELAIATNKGYTITSA